jgi:hypothetical protein
MSTRQSKNRKSPVPERPSPLPALAARGERLDLQALKREGNRTAAHVSRKDGRTLKRMTLYLPLDLARRLAIHCAEREIDMSTVVSEAVRRHLTDHR